MELPRDPIAYRKFSVISNEKKRERERERTEGNLFILVHPYLPTFLILHYSLYHFYLIFPSCFSSPGFSAFPFILEGLS